MKPFSIAFKTGSFQMINCKKPSLDFHGKYGQIFGNRNKDNWVHRLSIILQTRHNSNANFQ